MNIPNWYELGLLALAAWRVFQLIAEDAILDRPRRYVTRLRKDWKKEGDPTGTAYRENLADWIMCPYCAGFWIGIVWWVAWLICPYETLVFAVPWVISAGVIGASKILSA